MLPCKALDGVVLAGLGVQHVILEELAQFVRRDLRNVDLVLLHRLLQLALVKVAWNFFIHQLAVIQETLLLEYRVLHLLLATLGTSLGTSIERTTDHLDWKALIILVQLAWKLHHHVRVLYHLLRSMLKVPLLSVSSLHDHVRKLIELVVSVDQRLLSGVLRCVVRALVEARCVANRDLLLGLLRKVLRQG